MRNTKRSRRLSRREPEVTRIINQAVLAILVGGLLIAILAIAAFHDSTDNQAACAASGTCTGVSR